MSSKASRARRQEKRAEKFGRTLVTKEDVQKVIGMSLLSAIQYATTKGFMIIVRSIDGVPFYKETGPHALHVDIVDGKITTVNTTRRFEYEA